MRKLITLFLAVASLSLISYSEARTLDITHTNLIPDPIFAEMAKLERSVNLTETVSRLRGTIQPKLEDTMVTEDISEENADSSESYEVRKIAQERIAQYVQDHFEWVPEDNRK